MCAEYVTTSQASRSGYPRAAHGIHRVHRAGYIACTARAHINRKDRRDRYEGRDACGCSRGTSGPVGGRSRAGRQDLAEWMTCAPLRLEYDVVAAAYVPSGNRTGFPGDARRADRAGVGCWSRWCRPALRTHWTGRATTPRTLSRWLGSACTNPAAADSRRRRRNGHRWCSCPRWPSPAPVSGSAGAGCYDRSLGSTSAELVAVVYDDELIDDLPADEHDVPGRLEC